LLAGVVREVPVTDIVKWLVGKILQTDTSGRFGSRAFHDARLSRRIESVRGTGQFQHDPSARFAWALSTGRCNAFIQADAAGCIASPAALRHHRDGTVTTGAAVV
jgi:hypothetical protein